MMRSGYPKQNGKSYVRAHGRGQHDDNYVTPETPLKIRQERIRSSDIFDNREKFERIRASEIFGRKI